MSYVNERRNCLYLFQISHFKIPHYVVFVDSYPLTASGKVQKIKLREEMEKKLGL
ncbi:unnamed protein product [Oncorhynchus mykiss]|uniref:AMP-binding enzyme C-terminal domain-containing protein n=1 Tax=Oncorhynchus mykiss TaxID=8022 RepID=A0A060Z0F4_ONCMY|nr:unnamed protein product [Oncorhynchus mykiss]